MQLNQKYNEKEIKSKIKLRDYKLSLKITLSSFFNFISQSLFYLDGQLHIYY